MIRYIFLVTIMMAGMTSISAQDCIWDPIKVSTLSGRIELRNGTPIPDVKIEIRSGDAKQKPLMSTISDEDGMFAFAFEPRHKSRFYTVVVENMKVIDNISVRVELGSPKSDERTGLRLIMAYPFGEHCSTAKPMNLKT